MQEYAYFKNVAEQLERCEDFAGAYECWLQVLHSMPVNSCEIHWLAMEGLSYSAYKLGMHGHAISTLIELLMAMRVRDLKNTVRYADILNKLAGLYYIVDDLAHAEKAVLEARSIYEGLLQPGHQSLNAVARNLSRVHERMRQQAQAVKQPVQASPQAEKEDWKWFCDMTDLTRLCVA